VQVVEVAPETRYALPVYTWNIAEIQIYREELDKQGQTNAKVLWRATKNSQFNLTNFRKT